MAPKKGGDGAKQRKGAIEMTTKSRSRSPSPVKGSQKNSEEVALEDNETICKSSGYNYEKETDIRHDKLAMLCYFILFGIQILYCFEVVIPITAQMLLYACSLVYLGSANSLLLVRTA